MQKISKTLKDNTRYGKEEYSACRSILSEVIDKSLGQLESEGIFVFPEALKDAEDIEKDQRIFESAGDGFWTTNIMGFLGKNGDQLVIGSRFTNNSGENSEDYFIRYLLQRVLFPNIVDLEISTDFSENAFEFLVFLFPQYLKRAMRKGPYKVYEKTEYNDSDVKGPIDIARHIKQNVPFIGNVAYSRREFSMDNYLLELIRHTIEFIKQKPYGSKLLSTVTDEVGAIVEYTPQYSFYDRRKIIAENEKKVVRNAYYSEYRELQRLCILILKHRNNKMAIGKNKINGILFDGAWLWEEYVATLISDAFYHPMNKAGKGAQQLFSNGKGREGRIYPDFISRDSNNRVVADAKYKRIEGIGGSDYLQVLAYMFRFDAKTGYYIYPESHEDFYQEGTAHKELLINSGSTYEKNVQARDDIKVIKQGLIIPNTAESFDDFSEKMKTSEELFCRLIDVY